MGIADVPNVSPEVDDDLLEMILFHVETSFRKAVDKHAPMHSCHEGHSVIREELEELWAHVKQDTGRSNDARKEALQVAAMAVRYVYDLCQRPDAGRANG